MTSISPAWRRRAAVVLAVVVATQVPMSTADAREDDLASVREATTKYWDALTALGDGFVPVSGCETSAEGSLGIRYESASRAGDQTVDALRPEALIYVPQGLGAGRRLVAVEYSVSANDGPAPELFGQRFEDPAPDEPTPRYRLRVWLFSENPDGMFAAANPREACNDQTLRGRHGTFDGCLETTLTMSVPAVRVRQFGAVPSELRLVGEETGLALVSAAVFRCRSFTIEQGLSIPNLSFQYVYAHLKAPDWVGPDDLATRYPLRMLTGDGPVSASWRHGMHVGAEAIEYMPDLLTEVRTVLGVGATVTSTSSELRINALAITPPPTGLPVYVRSPRPGSQGMGHFSVWVRDARSAPATGTLQARIGSTFAHILGCTPSADPTWCRPVSSAGLNIVFGHAKYRTYSESDFWTPASS